MIKNLKRANSDNAFTAEDSNSVHSVGSKEQPGVNLRPSSHRLDLVGIKFNEKPDDDQFMFEQSLLDPRKAQSESSTLEFSRKELQEKFSHQDLKVMMLKSHINGSCKIGGEYLL